MGFPRWLLQKHQPAFFDAKLEAKADDFAKIVLSLCPGLSPEPALSICYAQLSSESHETSNHTALDSQTHSSCRQALPTDTSAPHGIYSH